MKGVERIQAAIDKLTAERDASMPGPWEGWKQWNPLRGSLYGIEARTVQVAVTYSVPDTELIETLHRTIDAQLKILGHGFVIAKHWADVIDDLSGNMRTPLDHALLIADAILGPDPH